MSNEKTRALRSLRWWLRKLLEDLATKHEKAAAELREAMK